MSSRITIFSNSGIRICEVDAYFRRTWKLNTFGEGEMLLSVEDAKSIHEYLALGNYIVVEDDKLPVWGGVIYTPREWKDFSFIQVNCRSAEFILKFRATPKILKVNESPGSVFQELIESMYPSHHALPVKIGDIWGGGNSQKIEYNFHDTFNAVKNLCSDTGYDWDLTPDINSQGRLTFFANWYKDKGEDSTFCLIEDKHIELTSTPMVEQGQIANYIIGYGAGSTWQNKPTRQCKDDDSINENGMMVKVMGFEDGKKAQLYSNTKAQVEKYKNPRKKFDLNCLDEGEAFDKIRIGNRHNIQLFSCGFTGNNLGYEGVCRIMGMTYDHQNNKVEIVLQEKGEEGD